MTEVRALLAEALQEHRSRHGWCSVEHDIDALLSLPRIAIVELPEGHEVGPPDAPCLQFTNVVAWPGSGFLQDESTPWPHRRQNPTTARRHATALLAAADAAEQQAKDK